MIVGIGIDLVEIARIEKLWQRYGQRFAERILAPMELDDFANAHLPGRFLAKRFAVKEAAAKAFGTGFQAGVQLGDIAIDHDALGKPLMRFFGKAQVHLEQLNATAHVSLSDERHHVVATVILERV